MEIFFQVIISFMENNLPLLLGLYLAVVIIIYFLPRMLFSLGVRLDGTKTHPPSTTTSTQQGSDTVESTPLIPIVVPFALTYLVVHIRRKNK